jgi:hypothetical protein
MEAIAEAFSHRQAWVPRRKPTAVLIRRGGWRWQSHLCELGLVKTRAARILPAIEHFPHACTEMHSISLTHLLPSFSDKLILIPD